jgi:hypothetical protein
VSLQSSLSRHAAPAPKSDAEIRAECRAAWLRDGIVCIRPEWISNWPDRTQLELIANKTFGKRRGK